jgi:hypothetical protein
VDAHGVNLTTWQGVLGYLNYSTGRADLRVQSQVIAAWQLVADDATPWKALHRLLSDALEALHQGGNAAFQDVHQARAVLDMALLVLPDLYRRHHADLLAHQGQRDLFQVGFVIRGLQAVLAQQGPWDERERIAAGTLKDLNDYVGHRPIAVLETRPRGEPYEHEKFCPLSLYLRGAGAFPGRYADLVTRSLTLLQETPEELRTQAQLHPERLDELACDMRAYDHNHPASKRPSYFFGEWDPHLIDNRGFFRRFVVRQAVLDALLDRIQQADGLDAKELLSEAAAVLAGTMLMGSAISGAGPDAHDSTVTLTNLMPQVTRLRDSFYAHLLKTMPGPHRQRLEQEAADLRQPLGGARQHLNHFIARQRAAQLQQRHLALFFAELGYSDAARQHAIRVPAASLRMLTEIHVCLTSAQILCDTGKHGQAGELLGNAEDVLHRAIACGAVVDPWNILGFQGLYPLFNNAEESVPDHRIGELVGAVDRLLGQYAHLRSEAAAAGDITLGPELAEKMDRLAAWWDTFATTTVHDVHHVLGREVAASAQHVAEAMARWRERGEAAADLAFWRKHLERFQSGKSFALVVDALLRKLDYRAAMGLLMNWLSQAERVPLEEGEHSFHILAMRWMLGMSERRGAGGTDAELVCKFMDHLEANADELWQVPRLERLGGEDELLPMPNPDQPEALYGAAYEGVTYQDSTDDGNEGELLGFEPRQDFDLEEEADRLEKRLRFISTVSRLFHLGGRNLSQVAGLQLPSSHQEILVGWLARARRNYQDLLALMDAVHERPVPAPAGSFESLVEFDRRQRVKHHLLGLVISTCLEAALAVGSLQGATTSGEQDNLLATAETKRPRWEPPLLQLEQAMWRGEAERARQILPRFLEHFQHEPLLFTLLPQGGQPRLVLRATIAQTLLRALVANLPRLGLLRETYGLLSVAQTMEREQKLEGPRVTEYYRLFQIACQACVEAVVEAIKEPADLSDAERVGLLGRFIEPFLGLWTEHSRTMRLSVMETVADDSAWTSLRDFIRRHGAGLLQNRFLSNDGNLRGILQRGVGPWLRYLEENPDSQNPVALFDHIDRDIPRADVERHLHLIFQAVVENYEHYKDYNTTTTQSDYGENLYTFLDFLRLKAAYERRAWLLRPLLQVHEVLVKSSVAAAALWQQQIEREVQRVADEFCVRLAELEKRHAMRLRTIGDRIRERFVQPLALDRVCALIEPAYDAARSGRMQAVPAELEEGLEPYLAAPTGSGLDVPEWVRRLEGELHRAQLRRTAIANLAENMLQVPRLVLTPDQLRQQIEDWPKP